MINTSSCQIPATLAVDRSSVIFTPRNFTILAVALTALACIAALFKYYWNDRPILQEPTANDEVVNHQKEGGKTQPRTSDLSTEEDHPRSPRPDTTSEILEQTEESLREHEINDIHDDLLAPLLNEGFEVMEPTESVETECDDPLTTVKDPTILLAAHGVNQYKAGGPAACTPLACDFIASTLPLSSEMIEKIILENNYKDAVFLDTENCIKQKELVPAQNPWKFQQAFGPSMQVSFERDGKTGLSEAVKALVEEKEIRGAIFTANGVTIAMRKQGNVLEFFDSHGDSTLTSEGNTAYVKTFPKDQGPLIVDFLMHRFPDIQFTPHIEIWPIQALQNAQATSVPSGITCEDDALQDNIKCEVIDWMDDDSKLDREPDFYFDAPTVKHYESSADRPPQSLAPNLLQIKIADPKQLNPFLPESLQAVLKRIPEEHLGTASLLVVGQATYKQPGEKSVLPHHWHDFYFQGPLARLQETGLDESAQLVKYQKGKEGTYSWGRATVGMFGRFGRTSDTKKEEEAIKLLSANRNYDASNPKATPVFMGQETLGRTEQQIHNGMSGAHGTSVYVSGENPVEGGFVLCYNNPNGDKTDDFGLPLWHLSLVMICNMDTTLAIRRIDQGHEAKLKYVREKLGEIEGSQNAVNILERIAGI